VLPWGLLTLASALPLLTGGLSATTFGAWPVAGVLALGYWLTQPRWRVAAAVPVTFLIGVQVMAEHTTSFGVAVLSALAVTLPPLVTVRLLRPRDTETLDLGSVSDEVRYLAVVWLSGAVCGLASMCAAGFVYHRVDILVAGLMTMLSAAAAQLVLLPLMFRRSPERAEASRLERWAQRCGVALVLWLTLGPLPTEAVALVMFPVLGAAALRMTRTETYVQLAAVSLIAFVATINGHGAFAELPHGWPHRAAPLPFYIFVLGLAQLIVPVGTSIARLKSAGRREEQSSRTVQQLLEAATSTVILATDPLGRVTAFNSGATNILGYTEQEVLGRTTDFLLHPAEIARHARHFGVEPDLASVWIAQAETDEPRDWEFLAKDGGTRVGSVRLTRILDPESGAPIGYLGVGEDVSERVRTQQALQQALAREQQAVARLLEVDEAKDELVSNVSHELRTPITSITGYAELLHDDLGELSSAQAAAVARIQRNAQRLHALVEDLLMVSRVDSGGLELHLAPLDLAAAVRDATELVGGLLHDRQLGLRTDVPAHPVVIDADSDALERVAVNLLSNAIKFTPDGGSVVAAVHVDGSRAVLTVADTGIGISAEDQERLFTRFFRSQAATSQAIRGTGLGLSIVQSIVEGHQGEVSLSSELGAGTTVSVTLPTVHDPSVETSGAHSRS